jgi:gamma-glutamyltranspeptidase/glutathione hydrolase
MNHNLHRRTFLAASLAAASAAERKSMGPIVNAKYAVVAAESDAAASAARDALDAGGNAADAAAAAAIASCMVEPQLVDLGGYVAAAVVLEGKTGKVWSVDADSAAPKAASAAMFRVLPKPAGKRGLNENEYDCSVENNANVDGALAVGVPATLAGIGTIHQRWGKLKWAQVIAPSQRLLADGFPVLPELAAAVENRADVLRSMPDSAAQFMPHGKPLVNGQTWHRPEMDWTLNRLASAGWQDFYHGEIAHRTVEHVRKLGGILSAEDLAEYQVRCTPALSARIGDSHLYSAALPNGGLSCLSALLMIDALPAASMHWHILAECLKLAWRDRLALFADGADAAAFLSPEYIARQTAKLKADPRSVDLTANPGPQPSPGTVHTSTADADGNLVAITISHGGYFGSCVTVPGTGITLGHGMCRFDPHPGLPNSIAPRKRPLNNVCPMVLRQPARDVAFGMRGGRRIVSVVTEMAYQLMRGHTIEDVVKSPRLHTDGYEPLEAMAPLAAELEKAGHRVKVVPTVGASSNLAERRASGEMSAASNLVAANIH